MIDFQPATDKEFLSYDGEFDRVMVLTEDSDLHAIKLAAEARIAHQISKSEEPYKFDRGVRSLPPKLQSMMMNTSYVLDYRNLLLHYAGIGFLHAENEEGLSVEEARERAERLAKDIEIGSQVLELIGCTDFDAYPMAS